MSKLILIIKNFLADVGRPIYKTLRAIFTIGPYFWGSIFLVGASGVLIWSYFNIFRNLPDINTIYNPPRLSTTILDRNGNLLYKFYEDENRTWVSIDKIPQSLIWATIAIEDKDFYRHHGISIIGVVKAAYYNFFKKDNDDNARGGSTITQQLVKKVFLSDEQTYIRKLKEAVMAVMLESKLSKDEILERYFNQVPYGGDVYGVQEASWRYFHKNVWEISAEEATFLAGLPAAPGSYSPFGNNPDYAYYRQKHVVKEMVSAGFITSERGEQILANKVNIAKEGGKILAPHFVFYVKDYLQKKFGYTDFERRGLIVKTSLDLGIQEMAQKVVSEEVGAVARMHIGNGAAMVIDPKSGEILAMVGSKDYYARDIDGKFNVATAQRQPGSSIKPINYLLALTKGMSLSSSIDDSPVVYQIKGQNKPYIPQNYNGKYMGQVTLKTALASSLNIPAVKLLAQNGIDNMIDLAENMGITTWKDRNRFGLALTLGGGEVKMTELTNAYSTFANLGEKAEINPVLEIRNYLGEVIYQEDKSKKLIVDPKYAYLINNALSDNNARAPVFGTGSKLNIRGKTVAVKTGTTNSLKDNWCIGWTPSVLVAAWVGNNDSSPMSWVASGISGATPIWNRIMTKILENKPNEEWVMPNGVYWATACGRKDVFVDGNEAKIKCPVKPVITPTPGP